MHLLFVSRLNESGLKKLVTPKSKTPLDTLRSMSSALCIFMQLTFSSMLHRILTERIIEKMVTTLHGIVKYFVILYVYCRKLMILNSHNRQFLYSSLDFILLKGSGKVLYPLIAFIPMTFKFVYSKLFNIKINACILRLHRFISIKNT